MGGRETDHPFLPLGDHVDGEVIGERVQHAGDGLCLGGKYRPGCCCGGNDAEPGEPLSGSDQPGGFPAGQVRNVSEPGGCRGAVFLPRHFGGVDVRAELGQPGVQLSFQLQALLEQAELLGTRGKLHLSGEKRGQSSTQVARRQFSRITGSGSRG